MISGILAAKNFMPAGSINVDGNDYLVKVGDKIQDVEELRICFSLIRRKKP